MPRWLFKMTAKHNRSEDALKNLSQGIENLLGWEYCCSCLFFTPLVRSYPFAIHSQNPPNFSPAFISYAQNADRQCSGLVLYSAQSNTLTGCINVPTNQPIPAYQHTLSAHTLTVPIPASPTPWPTRLAPLVSTPTYSYNGARHCRQPLAFSFPGVGSVGTPGPTPSQPPLSCPSCKH